MPGGEIQVTQEGLFPQQTEIYYPPPICIFISKYTGGNYILYICMYPLVLKKS